MLLATGVLGYIDEGIQVYTVEFNLGAHGIRIGNGELIQTVTNGCAAIAPEVASTDGWAFTGWSEAFTNVTANITVVAQYDKLPDRVDYYVHGGGCTLQHVIDIAQNGATILVGDGSYGPIDTADKTLTIRSVNGAEKTIIRGDGGRCALLGVITAYDDNPCSTFDFFVKSFGTVLEGVTLHGGSCPFYDDWSNAFGGGVAGGILKDCKIVACDAYLGGGAFNAELIRCEIRSCYADSYNGFEWMHVGMGGGARDCKLNNCLVHWCSADGDAGGTIGCDIYSCTIVDNSLADLIHIPIQDLSSKIPWGGRSAGINFCNVSNSVVWGNIGYGVLYDEVSGNPVLDGNGDEVIVSVTSNWEFIGVDYVGDLSGKGFFADNCTYPAPPQSQHVANNITNDPQFVDFENGNYRLQPTSPCIDAAGCAATNAVIDLDGKPRVSGNAADIGAYEYQYAISPIPELVITATSADVMSALSGSVDGNLLANVTNATQYITYRNWALSVKDVLGVSVAGAQAVKDSPRAWLSFALGADRLVPDVLTSDDIKIKSFAPMAEGGKFTFEVSVANVDIGGGNVEKGTVIANLKKVFEIEGAKKLSPDTFTPDGIEVVFDVPANGNARVVVAPPADADDVYFMRVKVK